MPPQYLVEYGPLFPPGGIPYLSLATTRTPSDRYAVHGSRGHLLRRGNLIAHHPLITGGGRGHERARLLRDRRDLIGVTHGPRRTDDGEAADHEHARRLGEQAHEPDHRRGG